MNRIFPVECCLEVVHLEKVHCTDTCVMFWTNGRMFSFSLTLSSNIRVACMEGLRKQAGKLCHQHTDNWLILLKASGQSEAEVPLDFKKYQYVMLAVQFFPGTKHSSSGTAITSMTKLYIGALQPNIKTSAVTFHWTQIDSLADPKRLKSYKRLKECHLIRRNRTKRAKFRGKPLFQATYNNTTENS